MKICQCLPRLSLGFSLILWAGISLPAHAAGLLTPSDGSLPPLDLSQHHVEVVVEDGYAITRVEQVFSNPHAQDIEALYSFPVPDKASVAEFTVWIDGKPVDGEVLERQEARRVHEEEKRAGRETGLTEQRGYKTFEVYVTPVRAGEDARVRLAYFQPVEVDTGIGRYVYPLEEGGVDEVKLKFWTANDRVRDHFSFRFRIKSAYPVDAVRLPGQPGAVVSQSADGDWHVELDSRSTTTPSLEPGVHSTPLQIPGQEATTFGLDRDLIVYWRLASGLPGSVDLITHKSDSNRRGTFMLVLTPGDDLRAIQEGTDWTFVLDVSGSMRSKYATLLSGVRRALTRLRAHDRFRIVVFNSDAVELTSNYSYATADEVERYSRMLDQVTPSGRTNLYAGLKLGLRGNGEDRTSAIVLVTDGVANVGETAQRRFFELLSKQDVRLFTFVMGNSANRPLLHGLTRASGGFAMNISNSDDIVGQLLRAAGKVTHEALHGVRVEIEGIRVADLTPARLGSLYRGQQLVVFGHYWGSGNAEVRISGKISGESKSYSTRFPFPDTETENPEIERLWAYSRIRDLRNRIDLFGENADLKQSIVDLAVEYGLVTEYTSMLVVRDESFGEHGIERRNRKRLQIERNAQQFRARRASRTRRVDTEQPMYTSTRPGLNGGGALDSWWLLLLTPLVVARLFPRRKRR